LAVLAVNTCRADRVGLANRVGYSADWLKRIEAGQRGVSIPAPVRRRGSLRVSPERLGAP
jgi:hypothetical protein